MARQVRTTISLPADLVAHAEELVRLGFADSRGSLVTEALRRELRRLEAARIDAAFYALAVDKGQMEEEAQIMAEFELADAEAFRMGEEDYLTQS